nr:MAG TPA: hypothetical protein [Caudoviricetes sp.]DAG98398.1 MAG TPA: hypothetical protein [Herelleviridae sp.]
MSAVPGLLPVLFLPYQFSFSFFIFANTLLRDCTSFVLMLFDIPLKLSSLVVGTPSCFVPVLFDIPLNRGRSRLKNQQCFVPVLFDIPLKHWSCLKHI